MLKSILPDVDFVSFGGVVRQSVFGPRNNATIREITFQSSLKLH